MDILELIGEALCCLDLPDGEVYAAMARFRDQPSVASGQRLQSVFADCVGRGLNLPIGSNHWQVLAEHPKLRAKPGFAAMARRRIPLDIEGALE